MKYIRITKKNGIKQKLEILEDELMEIRFFEKPITSKLIKKGETIMKKEILNIENNDFCREFGLTLKVESEEKSKIIVVTEGIDNELKDADEYLDYSFFIE